MPDDRIAVFDPEPRRHSPAQAADSTPPFAMVPKELIRGHRCDTCLRVYSHLDQRAGSFRNRLRGLNYLANELAMQPRTLGIHLGHLADIGWIRMSPDLRQKQPSGARSQVIIDVCHNPSRRRLDPAANKLQPVEPRSRKTSNYLVHEAEGKELIPFDKENWTVPREPRDATRRDATRTSHADDADVAGRPDTNSWHITDADIDRWQGVEHELELEAMEYPAEMDNIPAVEQHDCPEQPK